MKLNIAGAAKAENSFTVPTSEIEVDWTQNHSRFGTTDRSQLRESIRKYGQQTPVVVRRIKGSKKLKLVAGYGRFEVLSEENIGLPPEQQRPIMVTVIEGNDSDGIMANLQENAGTPLDYMDQARVVQTLRDHFKYNDTQIAQWFGGPHKMGFVQQRNKLLTLNPEIQDALKRDEITLTYALGLSEHSAEEQRVLHAAAVAAAISVTPNVEVTEPTTEATTESTETAGKKGKKRKGNPTPRVPVARKLNPRSLEAAREKTGVEAPKPVKRSLTEITDFFEIMIGSPVIGPKTQALAKWFVDFRNGIPNDEDDATESLQTLMGELETEAASA